MPPKRKRGGAAGRGRGGKKAKKTESDDEETVPVVASKATKKTGGRGRGRKTKKVKEESDAESETEEAPSTTETIVETLKKSDNKKRNPKIDPHCPLVRNVNAKVLDDYDCMLNQTNIGNNNNKFYVIQVIKVNNNYCHWNRWGRVGESGQNSLSGGMTKEDAIKAFEKKFYDKTRNVWSDRENFKAIKGKYTLIEMGNDDEDDANDTAQQTAAKPKATETLPCTLDKPTQELIKLIFDNDMFSEAMQNLEIDVKKMPLGKISKTQIAKGFEALEKISDALKQNKRHLLNDLSSTFYTVIPHNFGRQRPPAIQTAEQLQKKMDLLTVLGDIEVAQSIQKEEKKEEEKTATVKPPHDLDYKYGLLQCGLKHLDKTSALFKTLNTYLEATKCRQVKILDIWEVDRDLEGKRFAANDSIVHRKLLWHGTNVAVVVAILKSGLRIMPHSGGRVGKGIYFASENGKSAGYVSTARNGIGIMFLNEVALGIEHHISQDDHTLSVAPKGYDSIVAKGRTEPDPSQDAEIYLDKRKVIVPQGKPIPQSLFSNSSFSQSEYLIYREDQCRIRFILKIQF